MVGEGRVPPRNWVEVLLNFLPTFLCVGEWPSFVVMGDVGVNVVKTVGRVGCVGFLATSKLCWTDVLELWARVEVMGVVMTGTVSVRLEGETIVEVFWPVATGVWGLERAHATEQRGESVGNVSDGWMF